MGWTKEDSRALKKARDEGDVSAMLRIMYRATEGREPMTPERFYFWCVAFSHRWLDALPDDTLVDLMVDRGFTECIGYEAAEAVATKAPSPPLPCGSYWMLRLG